MSRSIISGLILVALSLPPSAASPCSAEETPLQEYLNTGRLDEGISDFEKRARTAKDEPELQFGLGIMQFLQAVEGLAQDQYRYGVHNRARNIPFMRIPVPQNPHPEQISYPKARAIFQNFVSGLEVAEATLSKVDVDDVKLPVDIGETRLDLNADGKVEESEAFWKIYATFNRNVNESTSKNFVVAFDGGDVLWLRGYCHLLMAMGDFVLAHDWNDLFQRTAHLFYPDVQSDFPQLQQEGFGMFMGFRAENLADLIAFIHLINFEVADREKMRSSIEHLIAMTELSPQSWALITAETDNDREWLPNSEQTGVIPNVEITEEMISGWIEVMKELQAVFQGERLLPYWRGNPRVTTPARPNFNETHGINLNRVFTEPGRFDLILWIQGTAATPYLESYQDVQKRPVDAQVFARMRRLFRGEFIGFAIWFN